MGKVTGFLEVDRVEKSYKPVEERIKSFISVNGHYTHFRYLLNGF